MKTLFIPSKSKINIDEHKILEASKKLPESIAIVYSIQFKDIASSLAKILSKNHKITSLIQILGCSKPRFPEHTGAVLLIGSGKFHAISLAFETNLPIYILTKDNFEKISEKDIDPLKKQYKSSYLKFLSAKKVGILVSLKPGQERLRTALNLKKKVKDKEVYIFLSNNINSYEFENYGLDSWINTACPRLDMNTGVINEGDLNAREKSL